jgi:hypothetical protein
MLARHEPLPHPVALSREDDRPRFGVRPGARRDRGSALRGHVLALLALLGTPACMSSGSRSSIDASTECPVPGQVRDSRGACAQSLGNSCQADGDCASRRCVASVCVAQAGPNGAPCAADDACEAGVCDEATKVCGAQADGVPCLRDQECSSGVCVCGQAEPDCSGLDASSCGRKADGLRCGADRDCTSGVCDVPARACGLQAAGFPCARDGDCKSGACSLLAGGPSGFCGPLPAGAGCDRDADCSSGLCARGACAAPDAGACALDGGCDGGT